MIDTAGESREGKANLFHQRVRAEQESWLAAVCVAAGSRCHLRAFEEVTLYSLCTVYDEATH